MTEPTVPLSIVATAAGLAVSGEIDAHTAPAVAAALAVAEQRPLVLDMAEVDFVDSSGLRVLLEAHQACAESGTALVLNRPSSAVRRLLDVAGLSQYLAVESAAEAGSPDN